MANFLKFNQTKIFTCQKQLINQCNVQQGIDNCYQNKTSDLYPVMLGLDQSTDGLEKVWAYDINLNPSSLLPFTDP